MGAAAPVLVGRARELAELDAALQRVRDGWPATALIGGEAGVGKSRRARLGLPPGTSGPAGEQARGSPA
jgi:hypothetical protein